MKCLEDGSRTLDEYDCNEMRSSCLAWPTALAYTMSGVADLDSTADLALDGGDQYSVQLSKKRMEENTTK